MLEAAGDEAEQEQAPVAVAGEMFGTGTHGRGVSGGTLWLPRAGGRGGPCNAARRGGVGVRHAEIDVTEGKADAAFYGAMLAGGVLTAADVRARVEGRRG